MFGRQDMCRTEKTEVEDTSAGCRHGSNLQQPSKTNMRRVYVEITHSPSGQGVWKGKCRRCRTYRLGCWRCVPFSSRAFRVLSGLSKAIIHNYPLVARILALSLFPEQVRLKSVSAEMTCLEGGGEAARNFAAVAVVTVTVVRSYVVFCRRRSVGGAECRIRVLGRLILSQSRRRTCRLLIRNPCHWREQIISSVVALPRTGYTILRLTITLH